MRETAPFSSDSVRPKMSSLRQNNHFRSANFPVPRRVTTQFGTASDLRYPPANALREVDEDDERISCPTVCARRGGYLRSC